MLISDAGRLLFVHVPKTGGASVEAALRAACPDARDAGGARHATYRRIVRECPETRDYWSFGIVRNPWARMVSWYTMIDAWNRRWGPASGRPQDRRWGSTRDGNALWRSVAGYDGFDEFVLRGTAEHPRLGRPQLDFLVFPRMRVDFVGRTESLAADVEVVRRRLGVDSLELPRRNSSAHGDYRDYYTDRTRQRVAEVFARDIAEFGYEFG